MSWGEMNRLLIGMLYRNLMVGRIQQVEDKVTVISPTANKFTQMFTKPHVLKTINLFHVLFLPVPVFASNYYIWQTCNIIIQNSTSSNFFWKFISIINRESTFKNNHISWCLSYFADSLFSIYQCCLTAKILPIHYKIN